MDDSHTILVAEKKVSIISFSGSISCPIVGKITQFRRESVPPHTSYSLKGKRQHITFFLNNHGCRNSFGFTLLEMLISLFIITVIVGISSVFFVSRQPSEHLKSGARDIVSSIRQARTLARVSGELKVVSIDIDNKTFGIEGRRSKPLPEGTQITITDPVNGSITRGIYRIEFYPSGLSGTADITLEGHNKKIAIHLDPVIGASVVR